MTVDFEAVLWRTDQWTFITVPPDESDEILERAAGHTHGFGSVRVEVTVGETTWRTSVFPDQRRGGYILPLKRQVRDAERLCVDQKVRFRLRLVDL